MEAVINTGILLINTGTPDELTVPAVTEYLREFLMDPAIIGAPEFIRKFVVGHIVKRRPERTLKRYEAFWTPEGSPFMITSRKQRERLAIELTGRIAGESHVVLAMRYGNPSISDGLRQLQELGCDQVVLLPAYPQQVNVCAGTCLVKAREELKALEAELGWQPQVLEIPYFYDQPQYQKALAASVRKAWQPKPGGKLVVSYHSTLLADIEAGDPYRDQAEETARNLAAAIGIAPEDVLVAYQSRFDSRKWLQPFTEAEVLRLAGEGVTDVCMVCPIFTADNIETAIEVDRDLRAIFLNAAGEDATFTYVPALGYSGCFIKALGDVVVEAMTGRDFQAVFGKLGNDTSIPGMRNGHKR